MTWRAVVPRAWLAALLFGVATLLVPFDHEIHQTFAQTDREEQDDDAEDDAIIFGQAGNRVVHDQQQHGPDHRAEEGRDAAQHVDEDALTRNRPEGKFRIGPRPEQAHDYATGRGEQRRHHKNRQLGAPDVDANETGAAGVVADHAPGVPERRLRDLAHQQQPDNQERAAHDVQVHMVRQIDAEEYRARNAAAQALIAFGQRGPRQDHAVNQHLKCQRDEGEVDFLQAYADGANCCRHYSGNQQGADKRHGNRCAGALHDQAEAVGAEAEEHAMSKGNHARVADQQIERGGEQAVRRAADHEIEQRLAAEQERQGRQHRKCGYRDYQVEMTQTPGFGLRARNAERFAGALGPQLGHATSLPNRPVGRATSTITMNRYIRPSVNSGKPSDPNDRIRPISSAPISAPSMEPITPITVTMKDPIRTETPMPGVSDRTGAASAPARPASIPPSANTPP